MSRGTDNDTECTACRALLLVLVACVAVTGCEADRQFIPETIIVSVLPDQSSDNIPSRFAPLIDYLQATTGRSMQLVMADDYSALLQSFVNQDVHLAFFGGLTYVRAEEAAGAEPLVLRDVDVAFRSCYVTGADDQRLFLEDFEDSAFSFGPELSTSGHLMPRYFMQRAGIVPEAFFRSVQHSEGHDQTALQVADSVVDIGVMNCSIYDELVEAGTISDREVRLLTKTPAYVNYVWAIQPAIDEQLKRELVDAFLALDIADAEHEAILRPLRAGVFLPAGRADFEDVRRAVLETSDK